MIDNVKIGNTTLATSATDVTATATEINVLDNIPATLTSTELGYCDGVTSAIQTQLNTKGIGTQSHPAYTIGTVYQNTGTASMFVSVVMTNTNASVFYLATDANNPPVQSVSAFTITANGYVITLSGWVLPNNYYRIVKLSGLGVGSVTEWIEWSL